MRTPTTLIRLILNLSAKLPLQINHLLGSCIGKILLLVNSEQQRVSEINLKKCFPELSEKEHRILLQETLQETGKTILETGHIWQCDKTKFFDLISEVHGEQHLEQALAKGKGAILAIPHLGNWEVIGLYCSARYPMTSLYRPPRRSGLDTYIRHSRERFGAKLVPTDAKGVRALYQALANNELVAILPDQDPGETGGYISTFFGLPANTMTLLSRLANRSGATVLCTYTERLSHGRGFSIHFEPAPAELYEKDLDISIAALNQMLEQCIRRLPAQYQWGYKRFRYQLTDRKHDIYDNY